PFRIPRLASNPGFLRAATVAIHIFTVLILSTSAASAAKESLPGDFLYGLKTGFEHVQLAAAATPDKAALVRVKSANERLTEFQRAVASDNRRAADVAAANFVSTIAEAQKD